LPNSPFAFEQVLHVGGFRDVALDGDRLAAGSLDRGDDALGALSARRVIDHNRSAGRGQRLGGRGANTLRCAGDDRNFAFEIAHDFLLDAARRHCFDNLTTIEI